MTAMKRRTILQLGVGGLLAGPLLAAVRDDQLEAAAGVLTKAVDDKRVEGAALCVRQGASEFAKAFGSAKSPEAMFLLGSISKPICVTAVMTLFDQGKFRLEDPVQKFIPEFTGGSRDKVTIQHLLTHVSGLPDQLPENQALRSGHASLAKFVAATAKTPLLFEPGTRYSYSSMAILLAAEIGQRISGVDFLKFMDTALFEPLGMRHSALGFGKFKLEGLMRSQADGAAPESGAGDPTANEWDWNSPYWRKLGAPWGTVHSSAPDVARFLAEIMNAEGKAIKPETARLMVQNHNPKDVTPRGLGFAVGASAGSAGCSEKTFGHSGSTGTLAWADPETKTICVVLTTLPSRAANPHPVRLGSDQVAKTS